MGGLVIVNLFAYRAPKPLMLKRASDPIGPHNNDYLELAADREDHVIFAWGGDGRYRGQDQVAMTLMGDRARVLGKTNGGMPNHPCGLSKNYRPAFKNCPQSGDLPRPDLLAAIAANYGRTLSYAGRA